MTVIPKPWWKPSRAKLAQKRLSELATLKSADRARPRPPPTAARAQGGGRAASPDGTLLATSRGGFSTTQLWRADTGARFAATFVAGALPFTERTFDLAHFLANRPTFSPNGNRLVTTGLDRATVSWTLDPDQWRDAACAIAGRDLTKGEWRQYLPDRDPYPLCEGE